jgi:hypothetical protein
MKKIFVQIPTLLILLILFSCGGKGTHYEQFSDDKTFTNRISDLNKSIEQIRIEEKGNLIKEDLEYLEYAYEVGLSDSYVISYRFDEKGCYEVGIYSYFVEEANAQNLVDGVKKELINSTYGSPIEDNDLCRWINNDESISVEIDYSKTTRGEIIATIFANE